VTRVDGDDHLARLAAVGLRFLDGFHRLRIAVEQVHHQPPAVRIHRFQKVGARAHRGAEVEHHPRFILMLADADVLRLKGAVYRQMGKTEEALQVYRRLWLDEPAAEDADDIETMYSALCREVGKPYGNLYPMLLLQ